MCFVCRLQIPMLLLWTRRRIVISHEAGQAGAVPGKRCCWRWKALPQTGGAYSDEATEC